jgi:tetratricopeptide (TPR) repeat protein
VEPLQALVASQQHLDDGVQKLLLIVTNDQQVLRDISGDVERLQEHLDKGVNLNDATLERLAQLLDRKAENSRQVRRLALRELGPAVVTLLQDQVSRLQIRAIELTRTGELDRAMDELRAGLTLVAALLVEAPTDVMLRLQLGFVYKTVAQVLQEAGDAAQAEGYVASAEEVFRLVQDDLGSDKTSAVEVANAIHLSGNLLQQKGDYVGAIEKYKVATSILPEQCYSWHDMFGCYLELAKQGHVDAEAMRHALEMVNKTGLGQPGLSAHYIAQLAEWMKPFETEGTAGAKAASEP